MELADNEGFIVQTGQGSLLILETQVSGKRRMSACDFVRGYDIDKGSILGD
jgi:methionyl-tRNA formyltransferase